VWWKPKARNRVWGQAVSGALRLVAIDANPKGTGGRVIVSSRSCFIKQRCEVQRLYVDDGADQDSEPRAKAPAR
jgi:hypothetical protein